MLSTRLYPAKLCCSKWKPWLKCLGPLLHVGFHQSVFIVSAMLCELFEIYQSRRGRTLPPIGIVVQVQLKIPSLVFNSLVKTGQGSFDAKPRDQNNKSESAWRQLLALFGRAMAPGDSQWWFSTKNSKVFSSPFKPGYFVWKKNNGSATAWAKRLRDQNVVQSSPALSPSHTIANRLQSLYTRTCVAIKSVSGTCGLVVEGQFGSTVPLLSLRALMLCSSPTNTTGCCNLIASRISAPYWSWIKDIHEPNLSSQLRKPLSSLARVLLFFHSGVGAAGIHLESIPRSRGGPSWPPRPRASSANNWVCCCNFFPAAAYWPVWPGQSTVTVGRALYRSI